MSGHSHWAGIKRKKEVVDAKRGHLFSRLARQISVAAREGGGDVDTNLKLRYAIDSARAASMPKENIERAVKKGTGELGGEALETITYEGYGPGGVAILIEVLTDNRNRTAAEVRKTMEVRGGRLGGIGSVGWMFEKKGLFIIDADSVDEDALMEIVLDAGAEDMERIESAYHVKCAPGDFDSVRRALEDRNVKADPAELSQIPVSNVQVDEATGRKVLGLLEELDANDDVQNVYCNFELPESLLAQMS